MLRGVVEVQLQTGNVAVQLEMNWLICEYSRDGKPKCGQSAAATAAVGAESARWACSIFF